MALSVLEVDLINFLVQISGLHLVEHLFTRAPLIKNEQIAVPLADIAHIP